MLRAQFKRNLMGIYRLLFYFFIQLLYNEREHQASQPQHPIQTQQKNMKEHEHGDKMPNASAQN